MGINIILPGGTVGYPAHPRLICLSVCLFVRSLLIILWSIYLIPMIKATVETFWN